jgi:2-polyprenyl-3-methyl-5-hydroxy-6-metoxy-1,4-benzoquinol methylase
MNNPFSVVLSLPRTVLWKVVWEIRGKHQDVVAARGGIGMSLEELDRTAEYIAATLDLGSDDTVLDVGCNVGYMVGKFAVQARRVTGVDISSTAIARARELLRHQANAEVFQAEAARIPKPSGSFSKIVCFGVTLHFPSKAYWKEFLKEVKRLLEPGGVALIGDIPRKGKLDFDMMSRYSFLKKLYMIPITIGVDLVIQKRYTEAEVLQAATEAGLVARILRQPASLPFYESRFDVLLSRQ